MSVRVALLALLQPGSRHGYQLKAEFDELTGKSWPLNYGQVYQSLQRLEKAGAIANLGEDGDGRIRYELTTAGQGQVDEWMTTPVQQSLAARDEIAMKVLVALHLDPASSIGVIDTQRHATMSTLQSITKLKADGGDLAWLLHLDRSAILAEAEIRWLDLAEERISQQPSTTPSEPSPQAQTAKETV